MFVIQLILFSVSNDNVCKSKFWFLSPKGRRTQAQGAQYNEFLESELKTRLQWIGQRSQWTKDGKKARKNREKQVFCKETPHGQSPRRVILEYITLGLYYNFSSLCYSAFSYNFSDPLFLEDLSHYIAHFR